MLYLTANVLQGTKSMTRLCWTKRHHNVEAILEARLCVRVGALCVIKDKKYNEVHRAHVVSNPGLPQPLARVLCMYHIHVDYSATFINHIHGSPRNSIKREAVSGFGTY